MTTKQDKAGTLRKPLLCIVYFTYMKHVLVQTDIW